MKSSQIRIYYIFLLALLPVIAGCSHGNFENPAPAGREPAIDPDYSGVTIPPNIAPMNFFILDKAGSYRITARSSNGESLIVYSADGKVKFPVRSWKKLLVNGGGGSIQIEVVAGDESHSVTSYSPITLHIAKENVDPYLCYRLLYPGYRSWAEMKIVQRSLEDFSEYSIFENQMMENNCVNCHSFNKNNPDQFMLHVRGSRGGTYFFDGKKLTRTMLKTKEMPANAVYPSWHPSGRYVAFSSNKTVQSFHMRPEKNIEVFDLYSSLVVYDLEKNEMFACPEKDTVRFMETFPCWSADGKYLYYCRTPQPGKGADFSSVKYDLVRKSFDPVTGMFGDAETVFNAQAAGKSVSFPVVSPDGNYLVFTLHDYGTFSIWHKEADLYLLDLKSGSTRRMGLNSDATESWHCWSSNGRWMVFSSKRGDGLTARPYFSYFVSPDSTGKPFVLPQEDPTFYTRFPKTFNRPELITGRVKPGPGDYSTASDQLPLKPAWTVKTNKQVK